MSRSLADTDATPSSYSMGSLSQTVVEAVAEAEDADPLELEPLYSVIDPDALDSVFEPQLTPGDAADQTAEIRFEYQGYQVRVTATGQVTLEDTQT